MDLLYAQQMDRMLSAIERERPLAIMLQAIANARERFCALASTAVAQSSIRRQGSAPPAPPSESASSDDSYTNATDAPAVAASPELLLQLFENVVDAKSVAQAAAPKPSGKHSSVIVASATTTEPASAAFLTDLLWQRVAAEHQQNEARAREHCRLVSARRIQRHYRAHRTRVQERHRTVMLQRLCEARAARVLQVQADASRHLAEHAAVPSANAHVADAAAACVQTLSPARASKASVAVQAPESTHRSLLLLAAHLLAPLRLSYVLLCASCHRRSATSGRAVRDSVVGEIAPCDWKPWAFIGRFVGNGD